MNNSLCKSMGSDRLLSQAGGLLVLWLYNNNISFVIQSGGVDAVPVVARGINSG